MSSVVEDYKSVCAECGAKPNSAVLKFLADVDPATLQSWDLHGNMVGTKGAVAIAKLVSRSFPELQSLSLRGNNVGSPATEEIYKALVEHPHLTSLDLSHNDIRLGGPSLVELVKKNKRITTLNVRETFLRPLFERLIAINVQNNAAAAAEKSKSTNVKPHKQTQFAAFTFGDANEENDEAFAQEDGEAFANFRKAMEDNNHVSFTSDAVGGKKVKRRPTVASEVIRDDELDNFVPQVYEKDEKTRRWLSTVLEHHDLFSHLDDRELLICVDAAMEADRAEGDSIFEQGDEDGDLFYVIGSGEVELVVDGEVSKTLKKGDTTQDLMLMYPGTYTETARCVTAVKLFSLDRTTYKCAVSQASKKKRAMYEGFLSSVEKFKCLSHLEILQLADALKPAIYPAGTKLIKYGDDGLNFFLIVEGTVEVYGRNAEMKAIKVCEFTVGDCVGELEFLNDHKCVADVVAKDDVRVAKMNRHHFEMVMGPVKEILARTADESEVYTYYREQRERMGESKHVQAEEVEPDLHVIQSQAAESADLNNKQTESNAAPAADKPPAAAEPATLPAEAADSGKPAEA